MLLPVEKHRPSCMFFQVPFQLTHDFYKVLHVFAGYRAVCFDSSIDSVKIQTEVFTKISKIYRIVGKIFFKFEMKIFHQLFGFCI